jgi:hypothetical protein
MEDGIERNMHSLLENQEKIFEQPLNNVKLEEKKTLYLCYPNNKFHLDKCIITDKKEKTQELIKLGYQVSLFIIDNDNTYFNPQ